MTCTGRASLQLLELPVGGVSTPTTVSASDHTMAENQGSAVTCWAIGPRSRDQALVDG
jgi:hypothetical protein